MLRRPIPLWVALVLFAAPALASAQERRDTQGEAEMLERINALRVEAALPPLVRHAALDEAARVHSLDMAENDMLAHVSPRTGDPAARVRAAGVRATRIAQNIALRRTTSDAMLSILGSEPHRQQLLDPALTHVGLAAIVSDRGVYVTQVVAQLEGPVPLPPPALQDVGPGPAAAPAAPETAPPVVVPAAPADPAPDAAPPAPAPEAAPEAPAPETPAQALEVAPVAPEEPAAPAAPVEPAAEPAAPAPQPAAPAAPTEPTAPAVPAPDAASPAPEVVEVPVDPRDQPAAPTPAAPADVEVPAQAAPAVTAPPAQTDPYAPPQGGSYTVAPGQTYAYDGTGPGAAPPGAATVAPGGAYGAPTLRLPNGPRQGVSGYWLYYGSRWWYFPIPQGAGAGVVLQADPSVAGPPAGYDAYGQTSGGYGTTTYVAPPAYSPRPVYRPTYGVRRRVPFGWSPRRHYQLWIQRY
jgi:hypothetical protein